MTSISNGLILSMLVEMRRSCWASVSTLEAVIISCWDTQAYSTCTSITKLLSVS